jgi:hypothetical protein
VKLIKLKRTQTVCTDKERKREKERKNRETRIFFQEKKLPPNNKNKNSLVPGRRCPGVHRVLVPGFPSKMTN